MKIFENLVNVAFDNSFVDYDVKLKGHCHTTGKYSRSDDIDCNINIKLTSYFVT